MNVTDVFLTLFSPICGCFIFAYCVMMRLWFEGMCTLHFCETQFIVISVSSSTCREVQRGKM